MIKKEIRVVKFDAQLQIEAYHFQGIMQKFPNHFHEYYVIGFIEKGKRYLSCKNKEYILEPGDITLFNPRDNHACEQIDGKTLDYRCINIQADIMRKAVAEITGRSYLPCFTTHVIFRSELASFIKELHKMILLEEKEFRKEELFFFLLEQLMEEYCDKELLLHPLGASEELNIVCKFLEENFKDNITLEDLAKLTGLSKYHLLRSFTKEKGITPYSYLETIRIGEAKKLLEQGVFPIDVAYQTGFSDQSHFSNYFKKLIGLTPKQYMNIFKEKDN